MNIDLETLQRLAQTWLPILLDAAVKGAVLLAVAALAVTAMKKTSAAARQLVWVLALTALLALPLTSAYLPGWQVLPGWTKLEMPAPQEAQESQPVMAALEDLSTGMDSPPPAEAAPDPWIGPASEFQAGTEPRTAIAPMPSEPPTIASYKPSSAPAAAPPPKPSPWAMVLPATLGVWVVGTIVCLLPLVLGHISLWRLARASRRISDASWVALTRRAAEAVGLRRNVILLQSDQEPMPMVWGVLRPTLLLPTEANKWSPQRQRVVLLHELAHTRRHDCLAKMIAHVACSLYWFNPLCWVAFKLMQREAEAACDDLVLAAGHRPSDYATHLLEIASGLKSGMLTAYSSIAMARKSKLEGRLLAILDGNRNRRALTRWGAIVAIVAIAALAITIACLKPDYAVDSAIQDLRGPTSTMNQERPKAAEWLLGKARADKLSREKAEEIAVLLGERLEKRAQSFRDGSGSTEGLYEPEYQLAWELVRRALVSERSRILLLSFLDPVSCQYKPGRNGTPERLKWHGEVSVQSPGVICHRVIRVVAVDGRDAGGRVMAFYLSHSTRGGLTWGHEDSVTIQPSPSESLTLDVETTWSVVPDDLARSLPTRAHKPDDIAQVREAIAAPGSRKLYTYRQRVILTRAEGWKAQPATRAGEFADATVSLRMDLESGKYPKPQVILKVSDRERLQKLLAFFPQLKKKSNTAAGWKSGAVVELRKHDGSKVTVQVAVNDGLQTWNAGKGDWPVKGDLKAFLLKLKQSQASTRYYKALMVLPEPPLRDCRPAVRFFETRRDWANLALAQEATARSMKRVIRTPVENFIRPRERLPEEPDREGGPWVWVQTNLDGVWGKGRGTAENWLPWLKRKQKEMVRDRFYLLLKLGRLYRDKLDQPKKAASAFAESLAEVAFYTEPIDKLIARTWPVRSGKQKDIWGTMAYRETLSELSEVQEQVGDLDAAIETKTRVLLAGFVRAWNYRDGTVNRSARELWALIQKLPANAPLPPLFWFNVLSPERDTITFDLSKPKAKPDASDIYDLNIVARPGRVFDTLEVTADMESTDGYGEVNCYTVFTKVTTLVRIQWHKDKRKGRERMTKTFKVPKGAGVIRFYTWPRDHKGFQVHKITVKATFQPKAERPTNPTAAKTGESTGAATGRLQRLWEALGAKEYEKGREAARSLAAGGDKAVAFIRRRVKPAVVNAEQIRKLIADLGDSEYAVRTNASERLSLIGPPAGAALRKALKEGTSAEVRSRIKSILDSLADVSSLTADQRRMARAVRVLRTIDTEQARKVLKDIAGGSSQAWITDRAKTALDRLAEAGRMLDKPEPAILEMRVMPAAESAATWLRPETLQQALASLANKGPSVKVGSNKLLRWFEYDSTLPVDVIVGAHRGKTYVLLWERGAHVPGSHLSRSDPWEMARVSVVKNSDGLPVVQFELGRYAARHVKGTGIGSASGKRVAIMVGGRIVSIMPLDSNRLSPRGILNGLMSAREAQAIVKRLRAGMTPLCELAEAIEAGKTDVVRRLLDEHPGIERAKSDVRGLYGRTPLHVAVGWKRWKVAELLLDRGADINAVDNRLGRTALNSAADGGNVKAIRFLIKHGADMKATDKYGMTPLHNAVSENPHDEAVAALLDAGADINATGKIGVTPLTLALLMKGWQRDVQDVANADACIRLLLGSGAKLDALSAAGLGRLDELKALIAAKAPLEVEMPGMKLRLSALHLAALHGHTRAVEMLLEADAEADLTVPELGSPLACAVWKNHTDVVKMLIKHKADLSAKDRDGETALHVAASQGRKKIVEILLAAGADMNVKDSSEATPFHAAAKGGWKEIVEILLDKGADVNARTKYKNTVLHEAARGAVLAGIRDAKEGQDFAGVAKLLIAKGADVKARGNSNMTVLHRAVFWPASRARKSPERAEFVRLLIKSGADVNATVGDRKSNDTRTPLLLAARSGDAEVVRILLAAGADPFAESRPGPFHSENPIGLAGSSEVKEILRKHMAPAIKAAEDAASETVLTFLSAVRQNNPQEWKRLTVQPTGHTSKYWQSVTDKLRADYADAPDRLGNIIGVKTRAGWATAMIERPPGDKKKYMRFTLLRLPDENWALLCSATTSREPKDTLGAWIRNDRSIYQGVWNAIYDAAGKTERLPVGGSRSGGLPRTGQVLVTVRNGHLRVESTEKRIWLTWAMEVHEDLIKVWDGGELRLSRSGSFKKGDVTLHAEKGKATWRHAGVEIVMSARNGKVRIETKKGKNAPPITIEAEKVTIDWHDGKLRLKPTGHATPPATQPVTLELYGKEYAVAVKACDAADRARAEYEKTYDAYGERSPANKGDPSSPAAREAFAKVERLFREAIDKPNAIKAVFNQYESETMQLPA